MMHGKKNLKLRKKNRRMERWDKIFTPNFVKTPSFFENYLRGHTYRYVTISILSVYGSRIETKSNIQRPLVTALEILG
jgi:hypothetical protein